VLDGFNSLKDLQVTDTQGNDPFDTPFYLKKLPNASLTRLGVYIGEVEDGDGMLEMLHEIIAIPSLANLTVMYVFVELCAEEEQLPALTEEFLRYSLSRKLVVTFLTEPRVTFDEFYG